MQNNDPDPNKNPHHPHHQKHPHPHHKPHPDPSNRGIKPKSAESIKTLPSSKASSKNVENNNDTNTNKGRKDSEKNPYQKDDKAKPKPPLPPPKKNDPLEKLAKKDKALEAKKASKAKKDKKKKFNTKVPTFRTWQKMQREDLGRKFNMKIDPGTMYLILYLISLGESLESEGHHKKKKLEDIIPSTRFYEMHKEELRAIPISLSRKRKLKRILAGEPSSEMKEPHVDGCFESCLINTQYGLNEGYWMCKDFIDFISIWKLAIERIESKYGLAVSNYFYWLRIILFLHVLYLICALPLTALNPQIVGTIENNVSLQFENIFLGDGHLGFSPLYHANYPYTPGYAERPFDSVAFCFAILLILIIVVDSLLIWIRLSEFYKYDYWDIHNPGVRYKQFFIEVINMWNFRIARKKQALTKQEHIIREIQAIFTNVFHDFIAYTDHWFGRGPLRKTFSCTSKKISRGAFNVAVTVIFVIWGIIIAIGLNEVISVVIRRKVNTIIIAVYVGLVSAIFPPICSLITDSETWKSGESKMQHLIIRMNIMYFSMALIINFYWLNLVEEVFRHWYQGSAGNKDWCWERVYGIELYQIILYEFFITFFFNFIRYLLLWATKTKPLFDGDSLACSLLFIHCVSAMGIFYVPLISILMIARVIISFYAYWIILHVFCAKTTFIYHQTEFITPYLILVISYCLLTLFCNGYVLNLSLESNVCGPFQNYTECNVQLFEEVMTPEDEQGDPDIHDNQGNIIARIILKPGVILFLIVIFGTIAKMFHSWSRGFFNSSILLQNLLWSERSDRQFLFEEIYNIVKKDRTDRQKLKDQKNKDDHFSRLVGSMLKGSRSATDKLELASYKLRQIDKIKARGKDKKKAKNQGTLNRRDTATLERVLRHAEKHHGKGHEGIVKENENKLRKILNTKVNLPEKYKQNTQYTKD